MKQPFFDVKTLAGAGGLTEVLGGINCVRFKSVSGVVTAKFNSAGPITIASGETFGVPFPYSFDRVEVNTAAGASVVIVYGFGSFDGGGAGGGGGNLLAGTSTDPNADAVLPADQSATAFYLNTTTAAQWIWNPATLLWQ